jgi:hypothetical protein
MGGGVIAPPPKTSSPAIPAGPHGWLSGSDQVPFLVHADGTQLFAEIDGQRTLIVDTGTKILDLQFYLAP